MPINVDTGNLLDLPNAQNAIIQFPNNPQGPVLDYGIPLPSSFEGRFYLVTDSAGVPWLPLARQGERRLQEAAGGNAPGTLGQRLATNPGLAAALVRIPPGVEAALSRAPSSTVRAAPKAEPVRRTGLLASLPGNQPKRRADLMIGSDSIDPDEVQEQASRGRVLVVIPKFGGGLRRIYLPEPAPNQDPRPRFVVIEHYRLSSYFGNYGAGRTLKTFSLWPGEETRFYVRSWRRSEQRYREASSIFDSFTQEAANEFESSLEAESSYRDTYQEANEWKAEGSASLNLGVASFGGGGGGGGSSSSAREYMSKTVSKVATHHASKASSKRETTVSTELEMSEATEFETINERHVKNVNLSRVLNFVCRELNQELTTYLSLVDVSVAFVNDLHVYDEVPIHDLDRLIAKYVGGAWIDAAPAAANNAAPRDFLRDRILDMVTQVRDFRGNPQPFLENLAPGGQPPVMQVRRRRELAQAHPFYPNDPGFPEGVILQQNRHVVRTDGILVDALLGHGPALDHYALGTQVEVLRERQLANRRTELILDTFARGNAAEVRRLDALLGFCCRDGRRNGANEAGAQPHAAEAAAAGANGGA